MNIILWLFAGGLIGWMAGSTFNDGNLGISSLLVAMVGAAVLLAIVNLIRGRRAI